MELSAVQYTPVGGRKNPQPMLLPANMRGNAERDKPDTGSNSVMSTKASQKPIASSCNDSVIASVLPRAENQRHGRRLRFGWRGFVLCRVFWGAVFVPIRPGGRRCRCCRVCRGWRIIAVHGQPLALEHGRLAGPF